jgi:Uma2 family endonuclease
VEILSPSNWKWDLNVKRRAYRKAGVKEIWFVDPMRQEVIVDRLQPGKKYRSTTHRQGKLASGTLPGFWIDVGWLWADELPDEMDCLAGLLIIRSP